MDLEKQCKACKQIKSRENFYFSKNTKDRKWGKCKLCVGIYVASWQKYNPEKCQAKNARWKAKSSNPLIYTSEERKLLYEKQEGKCAICARHETQFNRKLAVDHCHATGKIRGLLCSACNRALGLFRDKISSLNAATLYLNQSK